MKFKSTNKAIRPAKWTNKHNVNVEDFPKISDTISLIASDSMQLEIGKSKGLYDSLTQDNPYPGIKEQIYIIDVYTDNYLPSFFNDLFRLLLNNFLLLGCVNKRDTIV